jgi:hypothetical protein
MSIYVNPKIPLDGLQFLTDWDNYRTKGGSLNTDYTLGGVDSRHCRQISTQHSQHGGISTTVEAGVPYDGRSDCIRIKSNNASGYYGMAFQASQQLAASNFHVVFDMKYEKFWVNGDIENNTWIAYQDGYKVPNSNNIITNKTTEIADLGDGWKRVKLWYQTSLSGQHYVRFNFDTGALDTSRGSGDFEVYIDNVHYGIYDSWHIPQEIDWTGSISHLDLSENNLTLQTMSGGSVSPSPQNGWRFRDRINSENDYKRIINMPNMATDQWTILMWIRNQSNPGTFSTVGHRTFAATNTFRLQFDDNADLSASGPFIDFTTGEGGGQAMHTTDFDPDFWFESTYGHMVGAVSNGSIVKTILDDMTTGQSTVISGSRFFSTSQTVHLHRDGISGIGGTDGLRRDGVTMNMPILAIWNRALSDEEIVDFYVATKKVWDN